ncbi:hypothetical protein A2291_00545 [candidate division WOR-1 bacterium RIFOXYB2_FULL_42_35]|uniref:Transglutaminase-like domain-containing protein n=1 Tax=candidate division WOR-1 bacterium RIFOXYC2_FULL_41_25 TaxID=1802586 RepID=A0A1F4TLN5_UNCSA|nr:MAG: hypothetical protein A2247_06820 [candidate division WOR-1 bacterium RIFOXYA2_FULL_41_14]OGC23460.1 MAG: hypothetical protein A2291_00545 [candidate division WOR-1 bacterium RIFOXYB2_FULL_42_35]OGC32983.1 MAG: hypothetical protein A2462_03590 [candidate division WOR-1 bacterium RIFOXYC2_FULL_41_25]OGC44106.1 MAG: hypothetical protein A2548_06540 [candidate division WOR-1 bacterium RIFOXYD2_FULL_41_8]
MGRERICGEAAAELATIVRGFYKLPARVVGGYVVDDGGYLLAGSGHAWVEVFINGKWQVFDSTPSSVAVETTGGFSRPVKFRQLEVDDPLYRQLAQWDPTPVRRQAEPKTEPPRRLTNREIRLARKLAQKRLPKKVARKLYRKQVPGGTDQDFEKFWDTVEQWMHDLGKGLRDFIRKMEKTKPSLQQSPILGGNLQPAIRRRHSRI